MKSKLQRKVAIAALVGFMLGVVWLTAMRFIGYQSDDVHYHANFALYIDDKRDTFDSFTFYEEVQSCGSDEENNPKNRVHMHDEVNHVVHVHEPAVTWGHFFANLGYTLGDTVVKTDDGTFVDGASGKKLTFTLNGDEVTTVANEVIRNEDVLLINYGKDTEKVLQKRYNDITKDAAEYNRRNDPSSCTGGKELTFTERLKKAVNITE